LSQEQNNLFSLYCCRCQNVVSIESVTIESQQSVLCVDAVHTSLPATLTHLGLHTKCKIF